MRTFPLRIGTPDGLLFEGEVQRIVCRSIPETWQFWPATAISVQPLEWVRLM